MATATSGADQTWATVPLLRTGATSGDFVAGAAGSELFVLGTSGLIELSAGGEVVAVAGSGGRFVAALYAGGATCAVGTATDVSTVNTVAGPSDAVEHAGHVFVSSGDVGGVSEIDPVSCVEVRQLASCPAEAVTAVGGNRLLLACRDGGLGLLSLADGSFSLTEPGLSAVQVEGAPTLDYALAGNEVTRLLLVGSGLLPGEIEERVDGPIAALPPSSAVASFELGYVAFIDFVSGTTSPIPGLTASTRGARVAAGGSGIILVMNDHGFEARIHIVANGSVQSSYTLDPPDL